MAQVREQPQQVAALPRDVPRLQLVDDVHRADLLEGVSTRIAAAPSLRVAFVMSAGRSTTIPLPLRRHGSALPSPPSSVSRAPSATGTACSDLQLPARPADRDDVEATVLADREARVGVVVVGALLPRPRAVDRRAVDRQPAPDVAQAPDVGLRKRAVAPGGDVEDVVGVHRDGGDELAEQRRGRRQPLLGVGVAVEPIADRAVRLGRLADRLRADRVAVALLDAREVRVRVTVAAAVVDDAARHGAVVVGDHRVGLVVALGAADVAPDLVRAVLVDELAQLRAHLARAVVGDRDVARVRHRRLRVGVARAEVEDRVPEHAGRRGLIAQQAGQDVGEDRSWRRVEPLGNRVVEPGPDPALARRLHERADEVAARPHLARIAMRRPAAPQREPVVVLGRQQEVPRAGLLEGLGPRLRVVLGGGELRDQVVVGDVRAVGLQVVQPRGCTRDLLLEPVPEARKAVGQRPGRDRRRAPVDEDPELRVAPPARQRVLVHRCRGGGR